MRKFRFIAASLLLFFTHEAMAKNLGHRVGAGPGEAHPDLPENSIIALSAAVKPDASGKSLQDRADFNYLEFDIQETADQQLVLFHDDSLTRMLPDQEFNRAAIDAILADGGVKARSGKSNPKYKDIQIKHLTLAQVQSLRFSEKWQTGPLEGVPTFKAFLDAVMAANFKKPIAAEVKLLISDSGRREYIRLLENYRNIYAALNPPKREKSYDMAIDGVSVLSGKVAFRRSFGMRFTRKRRKWCNSMARSGFTKAYRTGKHEIDLCR